MVKEITLCYAKKHNVAHAVCYATFLAFVFGFGTAALNVNKNPSLMYCV